MITIGDKQIPPGGVYDEGDGFDGPAGSLHKNSKNVIPGRNKFSWVSRGAFIKDIDLPSTSNGGIVANVQAGGNLTFVKNKCTKKFIVSRPSDKLITFHAGVYRFNRNTSGGTAAYTYMLRFFMSPSYSGGVFGSDGTWRDITPYYLDLYFDTGKTVTRDSANNFRIDYTDTYGIYSADLYNAFAYLEDSANFSSPQLHAAEADKIISSALTYYDENGTDRLYFHTESDHSTMWANAHDFVRIHKNLTTGKIPYDQLCSQDSAFFDDYTITAELFDEGLVVSVHAGDSGRASFMLYLKYVKTTLYDDGVVWSRADYIYNDAGGDIVYDKHLVYGFPGYDWIVKNGANSFDKTIYYYTGVPSGGAATNGAISAGSYNKVSGRLVGPTGLVGANTTNKVFRIADTGSPLDLLLAIDDFIFQEFDVHGRWGSWKDFDGFGDTLGSHVFCNSDQDYYNYPEVSALIHGSEGTTGETEWDASVASQWFHVMSMAWYSGYRVGLHNENVLSIASGVTATKTLVPIAKIPASFNRFITAIGLSLSKNYTFADIANMATTEEILKEKLMFYDDLTTGWDFHLCEVTNTGDLYGNNYFYAKAFRYDKKKYTNTNIGGNHLGITSNPGYQRKLVTTDIPFLSVDGDLVGSVVLANFPTKRLTKDMSFGAKAMAFLRDRIWVVGVKYQEYQFGVINGPIYETRNQILYSRIGEYNGQFHLYNDAIAQSEAKEIGDIVTAIGVSVLGGDLSNQNTNNLLVLGENGYIYVDLADNNEENFRPYYNQGVGCISRKSVITENGIAFWAGVDGVYMFSGQEARDITELGDSKINKTWRAIPRAYKKNCIGSFVRSRKWYMVCVPEANLFFVFDLEEEKIYPVFTGVSLAVEPSASATTLVQTAATETSVSGSFTGAAGASGYTVVKFTGASPSLPTDRNAYSAGDSLSPDTVVVSNGALTTFTDTGLSSDTELKYAVFPWEGEPALRNYKTSSPLTGTLRTTPVEPSANPASVTVTDIGSSRSVETIFPEATGSPTGYILVRTNVSDGSVVAPTSGLTYSDGQAIDANNTVIHQGVYADFSGGITDADAKGAKIYKYTPYAFNGSVSPKYRVSDAPSARVSFKEPDTQPTSLVLTQTDTVNNKVKVEFVAAADAVNPVSMYICFRKSTGSLTNPSDGTFYNDGDTFGGFGNMKTVHTGPYSDFASGFIDDDATTLVNGTHTYYIMSLNDVDSPNYLTTSPLTGVIVVV